jgi:hypothetical protein
VIDQKALRELVMMMINEKISFSKLLELAMLELA